jgi:single-stranded-DNA-specific exonuclease
LEAVREKRWIFREGDAGKIDRLAKELSVTPLVAQLLAYRGITESDDASLFLSSSLAELHDPFLMLGMAEAVDKLVCAALNNERVCVYGDYDVDGVTSVALLISFFRHVGLDCFYYIPNRLEEGYGLSLEGIQNAASHGADIIVTVDCGITAVAEAEHCRRLEIDLIITDHHTPGEILPPAYAVLNPMRPGCSFPFKYLAGVGVAFNLLIALRGKLRQQGWFAGRQEPNLREYLDLVALGTVADIVPLLDENRIFVKHGLRELTDGSRTGVQALKKVSGIDGAVDCAAVGFRLAPRLNAAGRLEDATLGVELLLCTDPVRASALADELDASNTSRQSLEQGMLRDVLDRINGNRTLRNRKSIVLASDKWHPGVVGIVASRIVDLYHRPTILISFQEGSGRGSGRSIPGFHLHDALKACSDHLLKFGGHKYAAGLSIDESTLENFIAHFDEVAAGQLSPEDLKPQLLIDSVLPPEEITMENAEMVAALEPFGMGNPTPVFALCGAFVAARRVLKERHVKLRLECCGRTFDAIGFNMAEMGNSSEHVDVAFSLDINNWNGKRNVQMRLRDIKAAAGS